MPGKGQTSLPPSIENNLAKWVVERGQGQIGLSKADVRKEARVRYARNKKVSLFEVPEFSPNWIKGFCKRHPETDGCWGRGNNTRIRTRDGVKPHLDNKTGNISFSGKPKYPLQPYNTNTHNGNGI